MQGGESLFKQSLDRHGITPPVGMEELNYRLRALPGLMSSDPETRRKARDAFMQGPQVGGALPQTPPSIMKAIESAAGANIPPLDSPRIQGDYLGNLGRWIITASSSPFLPDLVKISLLIIFSLSYLEQVPYIGKIISVSLDLTLAGGRVVSKALQKLIPAMLGLIPLPYTQLFGVMLVSIVGMFIWSTLAMVSFSRQDFTSAIESMFRLIPIPIGDALADTFLDANRTLDQFADKQTKFVNDIWAGLLALESIVQSIVPSVTKRVQAGTELIKEALPDEVKVRVVPGSQEFPTATPVQTSEIPTATPVAPQPIPTAQPVQGGKSLSRKNHKARKWKTRRRKQSATFFGRGSRSMTRSARSKRR